MILAGKSKVNPVKQVLRNPDEIMTADIEQSRISMDVGEYTRRPIMPEIGDEEDEEFEAIEHQILKRALKSSSFRM